MTLLGHGEREHEINFETTATPSLNNAKEKIGERYKKVKVQQGKYKEERRPDEVGCDAAAARQGVSNLMGR